LKSADETNTTVAAPKNVSVKNSEMPALSRSETGEEFDATLSKADASKQIDELRERSPRLAQDQAPIGSVWRANPTSHTIHVFVA